MPVMMLVMNGATLAIIWLGGHMVFAGTLGAGELISFLSYVFQILMSVMMISMVFIMSARAQASGRARARGAGRPRWTSSTSPHAGRTAASRLPQVTAGQGRVPRMYPSNTA